MPIAINHRATDAQAARVYRALRARLSYEVPEDQSSGSPRDRTVISSAELIGEDAAGGYYIESIPGFGSVSELFAHQWILLTRHAP